MYTKTVIFTIFLIFCNILKVNALATAEPKELNLYHNKPFKREVSKEPVVENENEAANITTMATVAAPAAAASVSNSNTCNNVEKTYNNCEFPLKDTNNPNGVYLLNFAPLAAYCQRHKDDIGWTVILRRNFQRALQEYADLHDWDNYKNGFGNLNGDHWLGLENIHQITKFVGHELWIQLIFADGSKVNYRNAAFSIGSESQGYKLSKGYYINDLSNPYGDILEANYGQKFSTYDKDNDNSETNCAQLIGFGWWYNKCNESGLLGRNLNIVKTNSNGKVSREIEHLASIQMAIRTVQDYDI